MTKPLIRKATLNDACSIAHLHVRGWQTAYRHLLPAEKLDALSLPEWEAEWKERLQNPSSLVLLAEQQGVQLGFIAFGAYRGENKNDKGEIYAVYLDPDMKGKGYGALLCQVACESLQKQGFHFATLWVLEENHHARRFYESLGFHETSDVKQVDLLKVSLQEIQYQKKL